ncbi:MAG: PQQ-dependent sugar dehydrogenase [Dehalococcoidia bacterium]
MPFGQATRWIGAALVVGLIAVVACRSGGDEPEPTPTEARGSPTATAEPGNAADPPFEFPTPEPTSATRQRWGHDPWLATGLHDEPWVFRPLPKDYRIEYVLDGLEMPTQMAAAPDGRIFIAEQLGAVRIVDDGELRGDPFFTVDVYTPETVEEHGLTGLAIDPDFEDNHYVYFYYTADNPRRVEILRVREDDDRARDPVEIWSWEGESPCCHVGGGMRFAPDGTLFVGVGDHVVANEAQNPQTPFGSVIHLNKDGSYASDNPFGGPVYAYGLRNPYDVAIDPETGRIFAGENGNWGQDAVVEIKKGANYGWPGQNFDVPADQIEPPLTFYNEVVGMAGMEFYSSDVLSDFTGKLYYCQFHVGGAIHEITFADDGGVAQERIVAAGCETDLTTGADGFLYFLNYSDGALYRIARDD